ncbi:MAG: hypothetical protein Q7R92_04440 [bacterium]|nr:hypothetical protein [bacterium]
MKHEIKKLNRLKHTDSFMQINYSRGFKFIDRAGELVNLFYTEIKEPPYQMTQRELIVKEKIDDYRMYRIAVNNFWYHDSDPQNLGDLLNIFLKKSKDVLEVLEIGEITRIGWRNYFVYEFQSTEEKNKVFSKLVSFEGLELSNLSFKKNINGYICNFNIKSAEKQDENKTAAIIFDIDCFHVYKETIGQKLVNEKLKAIKDLFYSDNFLSVINSILNSGECGDKIKT